VTSGTSTGPEAAAAGAVLASARRVAESGTLDDAPEGEEVDRGG
jgi:hypothetical protein